MHTFSSIVLLLALIILALGLVSVLRNLLERGPYAAPSIEEDCLASTRPSHGAPSSEASGELRAPGERYAASCAWPAERGNVGEPNA